MVLTDDDGPDWYEHRTYDALDRLSTLALGPHQQLPSVAGAVV